MELIQLQCTFIKKMKNIMIKLKFYYKKYNNKYGNTYIENVMVVDNFKSIN